MLLVRRSELLSFVPGLQLSSFASAQRSVASRGESLVARRAEAEEEVEQSLHAFGDTHEWAWWNRPRFPQYTGYVYRTRRQRVGRIRMAQLGNVRDHIYHIQAMNGKNGMQTQSGKYLEYLGYFDPNDVTTADDPRKFYVKADRIVHWLRAGYQPTETVANLLDWIGIIKRTGMSSLRGMWDWRIDKNSGPDAPEGWSWDGPQKVTWNNKPAYSRRHKVGIYVPGRLNRLERFRKYAYKLPEIEKFGFQGYEKIAIDQPLVSDPLIKKALLREFPNTDLPMY